MARTRVEMRMYQRARRARIAAEHEAAGGEGSCGRSQARAARLLPMRRALNVTERADDAKLDAICARGGVPQRSGKEWRERQPPRLPAPQTIRPSPPAPSRQMIVRPAPLQGEVMPPPRSMVASGGVPARPYPPGASVAEATAMIRMFAAEQGRVNTEQACVNADMARRLEALERPVMQRRQPTKSAVWAEAQRLWFDMLRRQSLEVWTD